MTDSLDALNRRLEAVRLAHEHIDATWHARDVAERAQEQAEAELHAKLRSRDPGYPGAFTELEDTKQNRKVIAPQLRNAGQTVVLHTDPDYQAFRAAELAYRYAQAEFEAALKARLPAGWEGDVDAPDFISLADVEPWLTALLNRILALRDFQPSRDAAVSLTAHDLRNFFRILDHFHINDRPPRPPAPADVHQAEAAVSDLLAWLRRRLEGPQALAELRLRLKAAGNYASQIIEPPSLDGVEEAGDNAANVFEARILQCERRACARLATFLIREFMPLADRIVERLGRDKFPKDLDPPLELPNGIPGYDLAAGLFDLEYSDLSLAGKLFLVWSAWAYRDGRFRPLGWRDGRYLPWANALVSRRSGDPAAPCVLGQPFNWALAAFDEVAGAPAGQLPDSLAQLAGTITTDAADRRAEQDLEAQRRQADKAMDEAAEQAYHYRNIEARDFPAWERRIVAFVESCKAAGHDAALAESIAHFTALPNKAARYAADLVRQAAEYPRSGTAAAALDAAVRGGFIRDVREAIEGICDRATQPRREGARTTTGPQPPATADVPAKPALVVEQQERPSPTASVEPIVAQQPKKPARRRRRKIVVDLGASSVTIDGRVFEIGPHHAQMLSKLVEAKGRHVTGPTLQTLPGCRGKNIYREIRLLIKRVPCLATVIRSDGNRGYYLALSR